MRERSPWTPFLAICVATNALGAPVDWRHLKLTRVAQGLTEPVCITSAGDASGRLFIAERHGKIQVLLNGELQGEAFLDLSNRVDTSDNFQQGILGVAFPPDFATKQYLYVHYTPQPQPYDYRGRDTLLSR